MSDTDLRFMHPYFMGAYAENDHMVEKILLEFFRDHAYWRRNFHPENRPPIPTTAKYRDDFNEFLAQMQQELQTLGADLKKSVPFFSPRYLGHMASDLLVPGLLAQVMTTLYNPNNVSDDAAPATLKKELAVGEMLAAMLGYATESKETPCAWGHLTSGGTLANYEGLWHLRAVKFYPIALAEAARKNQLQFGPVGPLEQPLESYSKWQLFNFSIRQSVDLMNCCLRHLNENFSKRDFKQKMGLIQAESLDHWGMAGFFLKHHSLKPPKILLPVSSHYSWEKSAKILGIGTGQLEYVAVDSHMRMRVDCLREILEQCLKQEQAVLAVIGVLGGTEFGNVDPLDEIVALRREFARRGLFFGIHADGAWGGYIASVFRQQDGSFADLQSVRKNFKRFPNESTWRAFKAIPEVDSVTVDPHKLGFLPFGCGAFIGKDAGVLDFVAQEASYVFDLKEDPSQKPLSQKLLGLGQYIMEGSKPGATAAAAYVSHRVIPLHNEGFGRVLMCSLRACEYLHDKLENLAEQLKELVTLTVPYPPDSNLICYCINPTNNGHLALMNHFSRKVFSNMKMDRNLPLQGHHFFASFTSLQKHKLSDQEAERVLGLMGVDPATFCSRVQNRTREADHIYMIRHTLMNPWLMHEENGENYLDRFCGFLGQAIIRELGRGVARGK